MHYPISFALQIGPAALENPDGFRDVVRIVLEEVKAAGMDCPVTVAPAATTVAPAATTVAPAATTVAHTATATRRDPAGPWEANYRVALGCGLRLTREQTAIWLTAPSRVQPVIREAIAQLCCESGKENGALRPVLILTAESESGFKLEAPAAAESEEDWQEPPCQLEEIDTATLFE